MESISNLLPYEHVLISCVKTETHSQRNVKMKLKIDATLERHQWRDGGSDDHEIKAITLKNISHIFNMKSGVANIIIYMFRDVRQPDLCIAAKTDSEREIEFIRGGVSN